MKISAYSLFIGLYYLIVFAASFLPFWYVAKRLKIIRWWNLALATVLAPLIFLFFAFVVGNGIGHILLFWNNTGSGPLKDPGSMLTLFADAGAGTLFLFTVPFSLSSFYSVWLIYKKYNGRRLLLALGLTVVLFGLWGACMGYFILYGLGHANFF